MIEQDKRNEPESESQGSENQTNDPGRTPGTAEGDEQTVEEDLRDKEGDAQK